MLEEGIALKEAGLALARTNKQMLLSLCRNELVRIAFTRDDLTATADDVQGYLESIGYTSADLGNAAGSLFRQKCWKFTGEWSPSSRKTNHAHSNRVWRYEVCPDE